MKTALVIGAGPAGLMAAEELAKAGLRVTVAEAKPSPARKFLMAGKSGLNLTKDEPLVDFLTAYGDSAERLEPMLSAFGPQEVKVWAENLGQRVFTGSSGRVFPKAMKASPLLRAWLRRLSSLNVEVKTRWRWIGENSFDTPEGRVVHPSDVKVLACGGASWARLGSDGHWVDTFTAEQVAPFKPANMGFVVDWSNHMKQHFGAPVKAVGLYTAKQDTAQAVLGEFVISQHGVEGSGIYAVASAMREGATLYLDLLPDVSIDEVEARLCNTKKESLSNSLRKRLKLGPVKRALFFEFRKHSKASTAQTIKRLPILHEGPRPIDEAISTAGGVKLTALNEHLMLKESEGIFAAGEMLDWEAPTGGYLLTACLATGRWAGQHAANWAQENT